MYVPLSRFHIPPEEDRELREDAEKAYAADEEGI